ncbi:MAG: hypothetical protein CBB71_23185 [Rhodopirellula sp. TMED11]|nr:MAG: hypothetical protein CBB71_23185 [Rhodopirellula sp. TMED11]
MKASVAFACLVGLILQCSNEATAQVIQLPSFNHFYYNGGSVWVPDGGTASLGGFGYSAYNVRRRRGLGFYPRYPGYYGPIVNNYHSLSISANVIDLNAMDQQLMGVPAGQAIPRALEASRLNPNVGHADVIGMIDAHQQIARRNDDEGSQLVRFARDALKKGNRRRAYDSYRMAIDVLESQYLLDYARDEFKRQFPDGKFTE